MDDLVEFLTARLDEDERIALAARGDTLFDGTGILLGPRGATVALISTVARFAARHDPDRVLRDVEAKRELLKLHGPAILRAGGGAGYFETTRVCRSCEPPKQFPESAYPCPTLRTLALPYAEHPDYREEWRP